MEDWIVKALQALAYISITAYNVIKIIITLKNKKS